MNLIQIKQIDGLQSALDSLATSLNNLDAETQGTLDEHYDLIVSNKENVDKLVVEKNSLADQGISGFSFINGLGYPGVSGLKSKTLNAFKFESRGVDDGEIVSEYSINGREEYFGKVDTVDTKTYEYIGDIRHEVLGDDGEVESINTWKLPVKKLSNDSWGWTYMQVSILLDGKKQSSKTFTDPWNNVTNIVDSSFFDYDDVFSFTEDNEVNDWQRLKSYSNLFSSEFVESTKILLSEDIGILEINSGEALGPSIDCALKGMDSEIQSQLIKNKTDLGNNVINADYSNWKKKKDFVETVYLEHSNVYDYDDGSERVPLMKNQGVGGSDVYYDWKIFSESGVLSVVNSGSVVTYADVAAWEVANVEPSYYEVDSSVSLSEILQESRSVLGMSNEQNSDYYAEVTSGQSGGVYSWSTSFKKYSDDSSASYSEVYDEFYDFASSNFAGVSIVFPAPLEGREIHVISKDNRLKVKLSSLSGTIEGRQFLVTQGEGDMHFYANGKAWYLVGDYNSEYFVASGKYFNAYKDYSSYPPFYEIVNSNNYDSGFDLGESNQLVGVRTDEMKDESDVTINLSNPFSGKEFIIKDEGLRAGDKNIKISGGSYSIEGVDEITIDEDGGYVHLYADGANWFILSEKGISYSGSALALASTASPLESEDKTIMRYEEVNSANYSGPDYKLEEFSSIIGLKYDGISDATISLVLPKPFSSKVIKFRDEFVTMPDFDPSKTLELKDVNGDTLVSADVGRGYDYTFASDGENWRLVSFEQSRPKNYTP